MQQCEGTIRGTCQTKKSACAALISNISEKDRAKDVEQFVHILRTFTNEMNKFENRFGKIRDEEKMLAVKKLMPESLLNNRFRGSTMSYSELVIALENIIVDKVAMVPTARKEAKGKRKEARETPERVGRAARQDTSQPGAGKEETRTCTPWTKMAVRTPKRICSHGAHWKRAKMSSGRK